MIGTQLDRLSPAAIRRATRQLRNSICVCGNKKGQAFAFCSNCHNLLPDDLKLAVSHIVNDRFVEAYHTAEKHLQNIRENKMWRRAGTYNLENVQQVWERWGKAAITGGMVVAIATFVGYLTVSMGTKREQGQRDWKEERQTA